MDTADPLFGGIFNVRWGDVAMDGTGWYSFFADGYNTSNCHRKGAWDFEAALVYGTFKVAFFALCVILSLIFFGGSSGNLA
jgi:hypothetical protein